jgi:hypothetical protein
MAIPAAREPGPLVTLSSKLAGLVGVTGHRQVLSFYSSRRARPAGMYVEVCPVRAAPIRGVRKAYAFKSLMLVAAFAAALAPASGRSVLEPCRHAGKIDKTRVPTLTRLRRVAGAC